MNAIQTLAPAELAYDVLVFMRRNVQHLSMLKDLLDADIERWYTLSPEDQRRIFDRQRRRFEMACPSLATKDRIRDAAEGLGSAAPLLRAWRLKRGA